MADVVRMLVVLHKGKKTRYRALTKRLSKPENINKLKKIQSMFRGHVVRRRHKDAIKSMRKNALKKTKKYQRVAKLQANIKGWLFRQRRERLLAKLDTKKEPEDDMFDDTGEFDAEAFFGIKEENLATNSAMTGINEDLMMKAIQIMTTQDPTA